MLLNQAYPAPSSGIKSLATSFLFGLFIALFLWYFEPFDINQRRYEFWKLLGYGLITSLVLFLCLHLMPLWWKGLFSDEHWKLKHQLLFYCLILFVIATLNGIYTNFINNLDFSWNNYWWIIHRTFALGGIPLTFITLVDYQRKTSAFNNQADEILQAKTAFAPEKNNQIYSIVTDLKDESFQFDEIHFLYAVAVGNYIDVYTQDGQTSKRKTYRLSLSSFEVQLKSSSLVRCHRSYLVNLRKVEDISGNAQGLKLQLKGNVKNIPVSRKYVPSVKAFFQSE